MDEDDFVTAIADDPDDVGTWMVYADWLQEHGDPRGEFLSLSIEFEHCDPEDRDRRATLLEGLKRLDLAHGDLSGMGHARSLVAEACFGLVTAVRGPAGKLLQHDADLRRHPVETAHVQQMGEFGRDLARSTLVRRVRRLTLHLAYGTHQGFSERRLAEAAETRTFLAELADGPPLRTTSLQLTNFDLDAEDLRAIGTLPCAFRTLTIGACQFHLDLLETLVEHPSVRGLETLDLSSHWGDPVEGDARHLACLGHLPSLRNLVITGTKILVEAAREELPDVRIVP